MPELANCDSDKTVQERVVKIHEEYIKAGAAFIRTNTFASNTILLGETAEGVRENIRQAVRLATLAMHNCGAKEECFLGATSDRFRLICSTRRRMRKKSII